MINPDSRRLGRTRLSEVTLALALVVLLCGQSATSVAATEYASGPVFGGTFTWTTPALAVVAPTGVGFLGVTSFRGRFVAVERNGVASTSIDGVGWVGHTLPGPNGGANPALIAAGANQVAIIGQGLAWTSVDGDVWTAANAPPTGPAQPAAMTALADGFAGAWHRTRPQEGGGMGVRGWLQLDGESGSVRLRPFLPDRRCRSSHRPAGGGRRRLLPIPGPPGGSHLG